jgi:hypothetical protein
VLSVVPGHMADTCCSVGVRSQISAPNSTRPPGFTSPRRALSASEMLPKAW